jgi:anhydro-N-acetylmuramic acid kinase
VRVLGLSSGTSYDGIDVALVSFEHRGPALRAELLHHDTVALPAALRDDIRAALPPARVGVGDLCRLDTRLGQAFAAAASSAPAADLVCSHGQTLFHWVDDDGSVGGTLQLGQPAWIAERTGLAVVSDVRVRDVAAGGQGAPLVPVLDLMLLGDRPGRWGALNLGGIANLTVAVRGQECAYDTGPGNALLDAAAFALTGSPYDRGGALAARGAVLPQLLERLLAEPYYARTPPKSTGKELFHAGYLDGLAEAAAGVPADVLATLTELTAATVAAEICRHRLDSVVVSGGGVHNRTLLHRLAARVPGTAVVPSESVGLPADAKEAVAFALIGWLTWHGLPANVPAATGARGGRVLGTITPGAGPLRPPPPLSTPPRRLTLA